MCTSFPEVTPHGEWSEVFPDVFFITGSVMMQGLQISRNMIAVREGTEISLFNTIRLDEAGLQALDALGTVRHVFKLGFFHGMDDPFYIDRYTPQVWGLEGMELPEGLSFDHTMTATLPLPISDASLFIFETSDKPESILRLGREGGVLITCDSLQNWTYPDRFFSQEGAEKMTEWGFIQPAQVGPGWLKACSPQKSDFQRLKELSFQHVLSAHGEPLKNSAYIEYSQTFKNVLGI